MSPLGLISPKVAERSPNLFSEYAATRSQQSINGWRAKRNLFCRKCYLPNEEA
jgi:hypothetical protein